MNEIITTKNLKKFFLLVMCVAFVGVIAVGCYKPSTGEVKFGEAIIFELPAFPRTGSHHIQVFSEMHYSASYRSQEVPRLLPPEGSVPITGSEIQVIDIEKMKSLTIPEKVIGDYKKTHAMKLYETNCQVCHGMALDGKGPITTLESARGDGSKAYKGSMPVDLTSDRVTRLSDGEIFGYITWGGRPGLAAAVRNKDSSAIMPQFGRLLTEEERWELVWYMRQKIGAK